MSRKQALMPVVGAAIGVGIGLVLLRRRGAAKAAPAEAQPRPPEPRKQPSTHSQIQQNGSIVVRSCNVQTGGGSIGNLSVRVGPSPVAMLLTGAVLGIAVYHWLLHREVVPS